MSERATVIRCCRALDILRRFDTDIAQALGFEEFSSSYDELTVRH
jgi:hypothetical protein